VGAAPAAPPGDRLSPGPAPLEARRADAVWELPDAPRRPLDLIYVLPHHHVTGGMKILLEHVRRLRQRGHRVRAAYRGHQRTAVPAWSDVQVDGEIVHGAAEPLGPALQGADAVVVGWYQSLFECQGAPSPVVYFEQGHEILFGDVRDDPQSREMAAQFDAALRMPVPVAAVSQHVAAILRARFGRRAPVWFNGIDLERFRPDGHPPGRRVLLVGNGALPFKGFQVALEALASAWRAGARFEVTRVSQAAVQVNGVPFPLENVVSPPQDRLPAIYREHDLFLFTSRYEAFPLPPIEAMASGVPVVATQCGGISTYALAGHDAVLCPVDDVGSLARAVSLVLSDPETGRRLAARGRAAAERFGWDAALEAVESSLHRVAAARPAPPHPRRGPRRAPTATGTP
jgi:glycosyltransferase involved in cell wall biosynthesis